MRHLLPTSLLSLAISIATIASSAITTVAIAQNVMPQPTSEEVKRTLHTKAGVNVFTTPNDEAIPYRIPAIAETRRGELIAVADYRHSRSDIGWIRDGRIDLVGRTSSDNGATWGKEFTIIAGKGAASPDFMNVGFGDPCIVADRESDEVLVVSCAGNVAFLYGQRNNHQNMVRMRSMDSGRTWSKPDDMAESIYAMFDEASYGPVKSMFMASGRIVQSRQVKVGDYYRIYAAVLVIDKNNVWFNAVIYSDDFGRKWHLLGDKEDVAITSRADEAKGEELPDKSVIISSRIAGGRQYNIYTYDDVVSAKGHWGKMAFSGAGNKGVTAEKNACNGEMLILPVKSVTDGSRNYLLMQSVPLGPGRANVGIYYKVLRQPADYSSPEVLARDWEGCLQVTRLGSAYSTMIEQRGGRIGFFYEEETFCTPRGGGFTLVYKNLSVEDITSGKYTFDRKPKLKAFLKR